MLLRNKSDSFTQFKLISEIIAIDDKKIVLINIEEGFDKPYSTSSGFYYTKVGSDKRKISREELKRLFAHSGSC